MKLESDKREVSDGSCSECARCLRLYLSAMQRIDLRRYECVEDIDSRTALPNSSSSAMLHSSSNITPAHPTCARTAKFI